MEYIFSDKISSVTASEIREILKATADPNLISFAAGNPSAEAFPSEAIAKITESILREDSISALQYSTTEGYTPLRNLLKSHLADTNESFLDNDELIVVSGAQQGISLAAQCFLNDGDTVLCEMPTFVGAINAFKANSANVVGIDLQPDGMDIVSLEKAIAENRNIKLLYIIPNFQNPTGNTTSLEKREKIYQICKKNNIIIIEDNPYGELRTTGKDIPTIKSIDTDRIVIYLGSFSKVLAPGLRVGFVSANKEIIGKFVIAKQTSDVHTNILAQQICFEFMRNYDYRLHIKNLKEIYKNKLYIMKSQMEAHLDSRIICNIPDGGLFLWCELPSGTDALKYTEQAIKGGVAIVPGTAFMPDKSAPCNSFRLNYSYPSDAEIIKGIKILSEIKI